MVKKILFVCKYNRFRSKFAEAYFNSVNRNRKFRAVSAGVIRANNFFVVMKKRARYILDECGVRIGRRSRSLSFGLLKKVDRIIVVANDVPRVIFNFPLWRDKVVVWEIPDEWGKNKGKINKILKSIQGKVDLLVGELENEKR